MSQWHRANPDLCGTSLDPSMVSEDYRRHAPEPEGDGYDGWSCACGRRNAWWKTNCACGLTEDAA